MARGLALWQRQLKRECDRLEQAMAQARAEAARVAAAGVQLAAKRRDERERCARDAILAGDGWFDRAEQQRLWLVRAETEALRVVETHRAALMEATLRRRAVEQLIDRQARQRRRVAERREAHENDQLAANRIYRRGASA